MRTRQDRRPGEELLWDSPIDRTKLEERTLAGLKDRMMIPEVAEEAMRAYADETNRFNRERRANSEGWRTELVKVEKAIAAMISAIEEDLYQPSMKARMDELERQTEDSGEAARLFRDDGARASDMMPPGGPPPRWPVFFVALGLCRRQSSNLV